MQSTTDSQRRSEAPFPEIWAPYRAPRRGQRIRPVTAGRIPKGDSWMKVAYVFSTSCHTASYKLGKMILPQLEEPWHRAEVVGMFFFDDNNYVLRSGDEIGERLAEVAAEQNIMLMMCDQPALERGLAT